MKKLTLYFLVTILATANIFAQNITGSINGQISDGGKQEVIDAATVSLFKSKDSALVKVSLTDKNGYFSFEGIHFGQYYIVASSVGHYKKWSSEFAVNSETPVQVGVLQLEKKEETLKEITITATKPFIERKIDRTVVNVSSSITSAGSNALEVLEKAPGVTVDKDGIVSLKGKSGVTIMLDGRPSYLSAQELANLLKNMPASGIEQIEIMTNPSSKYDASGNSGIINIKTIKNKMKGMNGSVSASISQSKVTKTSNSLNLNYRNGKVNLFGNYSYSLWAGKKETHIIRRFRNSTSKEIETIFDQYSPSVYESQNHNLKVGMDFYATKKTTWGVVFTGYINPSNDKNTNSTYLNDKNNVTDSIARSINKTNELSKNFSTNLNMRHVFDSTGKEITLDLDYLTYQKGNDMSLSSDYFYPDYSKKRPSSVLIGNLPSNIQIYSAKTDFTLPLKNQSKIEAGLKSSYVVTDNDALYQTSQGGGYVIDYGKTNHFVYKENINAGYINFSTQIKKWGIQTGLRAENTNAYGKQFGNQSHADSSFTKNYVNLFPTVFVSYQANEKNTFSVNYGRRIDRPDYEDLNPFIYFLDEYTYSAGNTLLQPQFTNNFELSHTYNGFLSTTINYSETHHAFTDVLKQITSERKTFQTKENLATKTNYGIAISAGFPVTKFWTTNLYTNMANTGFKGMLNGAMLDVNNWTFMGNMSNQFKIGKGWSGELSGFYQSTSIEGQIVVDPLWRMDAGIQKQVLNKKGTLKLSVRDIFNSMDKVLAHVNYQDIDLNIANGRDSRTVSLTFSYRFGKPLKTQQRKVGGASDEQNRIKSSGN
jgi:hypothetical protein